MVVSQRSDNVRKLLEVVVVMINTVLFTIPTLVEGEAFYIRWWHVHQINRVAGILLVPVAIMASFWIALFVLVGTRDSRFRVMISMLGLFFLSSGLWRLFGHGRSWASLAEGSLLFWGLALLLSAGLGAPR
jgi:hypothetical protein